MIQNNKMIAKINYYCWLSSEQYPDKIRECFSSGKEAVPVRKWASASDYIRLNALYTEGGIALTYIL